MHHYLANKVRQGRPSPCIITQQSIVAISQSVLLHIREPLMKRQIISLSYVLVSQHLPDPSAAFVPLCVCVRLCFEHEQHASF